MRQTQTSLEYYYSIQTHTWHSGVLLSVRIAYTSGHYEFIKVAFVTKGINESSESLHKYFKFVVKCEMNSNKLAKNSFIIKCLKVTYVLAH
jgi:hypothetical protein